MMKAADLPKARMPRAVLPKCGVPWCGWQVRKGSGGFEAATNDLLTEEGGSLMLESGGKILLEETVLTRTIKRK